MFDLPQFEELHVISDLHMGGRAGFQILREAARLAGYILQLKDQNPQGRLALVLNGDVFDTLAEKDFDGYFAFDKSTQVVQRIMEDASFKPVWDALSAFVHTAGRTLVFVIGNHDIEIALPPVQRLILARLAGDDLAAKARIEFSTMGAGYLATVAGARVYCTHGNEVDGWNFNRYEDLSRAARRLHASQPLGKDDWNANAGTRMVKDVMNAVKENYPWIDLLKPENTAAIGTLVVLAPEAAAKLQLITSVAPAMVLQQQQAMGRLSIDTAVAAQAANAPAASLEQFLGPNLRASQPTDARSMLELAEQNFDKPPTAPGAGAGDGTLGFPQLIVDRITGLFRGISKCEALRRALADWMAKDHSFDVADQDDTFKSINKVVGPDVHFVITGHTHLARAIELTPGQRFYFNSGTWIRLIQLTPPMLKDEASFKPAFDAFQQHQMAALDTCKVAGQDLVLDQTNAVAIRAQNGKAVGQLIQVTGQPGSIKQDVKQTFIRN